MTYSSQGLPALPGLATCIVFATVGLGMTTSTTSMDMGPVHHVRDMQPFDEISSAELGVEDGVLMSPAEMPQHPAQQHRYLDGIPRWMRPPAHTTTAGRIRHELLPSAVRWATAAAHRLAPALSWLLRPRLTVRHVLLSLAALWVAYRMLASQPLLADRLPGYTGPYRVGAVDVECPLETPRRVSDARFRSGSDGDYAFEVETVLFTLYYPASPGARGGPSPDRYYWFPKPVSATARGYARFLGMDNPLFRGLLTGGLWLVASGLQIPALVGAPLIPAAELVDIRGGGGGEHGSQRLPVMVFSHGMLSSRTDYTHYLGELASRGVVVAALEHRDGSSPASPIIRAGEDGTAPPRWRYAFGLRDLVPPPGGEPLDTPALKEAQLSFREAEIEAAVDVIRALDSGPPSPSSPPMPNSRQPPNTDMSSFVGRLNTAHLTLAGHSYGGTGALRALRPVDTSEGSGRAPPPRLPFSGAVVLDPGRSSGPLNADVSVPLAICHSSSWSRPGPSLFYGRPHFEVVRDIAEGVNNRSTGPGGPGHGGGGSGSGSARAGAWFLTSLGTSHPSITDAPLLEPLLLSWATGSTMGARDGIMQYVLATRDFVRYQHTGERRGVLALSGRPVEDGGAASRDYDPKHNAGMPEPWRKYWQIHVAPE